MTYKEVNTMIASVGIPCAYNQFTGTGTTPPFICFLYGGSNDMLADNRNFQRIRPLSIELYTDNKDFELEAAVEAMLTSNELPYTREETYLESEQMFMVVFETQVIIDDDEGEE